MKILHILKTKPDYITKTLMDHVTSGKDVTIFRLYDEQVDYEKLIDLIFEHDKTVSWW